MRRVPKRGERVIFHSGAGDVPAEIMAANTHMAALVYNNYALRIGEYALTARHGTGRNQWRWPSSPTEWHDLVIQGERPDQ